MYYNQLKCDLQQYNGNRLVFVDFIHIQFSLLYGRCIVMDVKFEYPVCHNMIERLNQTIRKSLYGSFFVKYFQKHFAHSRELKRCCFDFITISNDGKSLSYLLFTKR